MKQSPKDLIPYFFGETAKTYDKVVFWSTLGRDNYWKKEIVNKIENADSVLDLACGTGILTRMIATKFPQSKIVGIDISKSYLNNAEKKSFSNIEFIHQDAEKMNLDQKFDYICSSYIPKYCNPKILIKRCIDHLNSEGVIILHDFVYPTNSIVKMLWEIEFVLLNFIGIFLPSWKYAFIELPNLIRKSIWVKQYKEELEKNGFEVTLHYLTCNSSAILYARKNNT